MDQQVAQPADSSPPEIVTGAQLAVILGVSKDKVYRWTRKRLIQRDQRGRYAVTAVRRAFEEHAARPELRPTTRRCYLCKRELPLDEFRTITTTQRHQGRVYRYTGPSSDCRECNREYKREARRRSADAAGRPFEARGDRTAWEASRREIRAQRRADGLRRLQAHHAEQKSASERLRRHRLENPELECLRCRATKPSDDFYPSMLEHALCRACCDTADVERFARASDSLADTYVKRQIAKKSGLRHAQIPQSLVEAERARLMVQRLVGPWKRPSREERKTRKAP